MIYAKIISYNVEKHWMATVDDISDLEGKVSKQHITVYSLVIGPQKKRDTDTNARLMLGKRRRRWIISIRHLAKVFVCWNVYWIPS